MKQIGKKIITLIITLFVVSFNFYPTFIRMWDILFDILNLRGMIIEGGDKYEKNYFNTSLHSGNILSDRMQVQSKIPYAIPRLYIRRNAGSHTAQRNRYKSNERHTLHTMVHRKRNHI